LFHEVDFRGYHAVAPNVSLGDITYTEGDTSFTNQRNIAGATSQGLSLGTALVITSYTGLNAKAFYDDVNYNTEFSDSSNYDSSGIGGGLGLEQILSKRLKMSLTGEVRPVYNTYGSKFSWAPEFGQHLGLRVAASAQRLISHNQTSNSNSYGLELSLFNDEATQTPNYTLTPTEKAPNLVDWVTEPAVYMERVLAIAEQKTQTNTPSGPGVVSAISSVLPITYSGTRLDWSGTNDSTYVNYFTTGTGAPSNGESVTDFRGFPPPATVSSTSVTTELFWGFAPPNFYAFICLATATTYNTQECTNAVPIPTS